MISRDGLKKMVMSRMDMQDLYLPIHFLDLVDEMPKVETGRPNGRWLDAWSGNDVVGYACSQCDYFITTDLFDDFDFCPSCGADMKN